LPKIPGRSAGEVGQARGKKKQELEKKMLAERGSLRVACGSYLS
jgi:hypothetical protein